MSAVNPQELYKNIATCLYAENLDLADRSQGDPLYMVAEGSDIDAFWNDCFEATGAKDLLDIKQDIIELVVLRTAECAQWHLGWLADTFENVIADIRNGELQRPRRAAPCACCDRGITDWLLEGMVTTTMFPLRGLDTTKQSGRILPVGTLLCAWCRLDFTDALSGG